MKNIKFLVLILVTGSALAMTANYTPHKASAEVQTVRGKYVYVDSQPVLEYRTLGEVKVSMTMSSGQYMPMRNQLVKKGIKKFPQADGYILYFSDGGSDIAEAIQFK